MAIINLIRTWYHTYTTFRLLVHSTLFWKHFWGSFKKWVVLLRKGFVDIGLPETQGQISGMIYLTGDISISVLQKNYELGSEAGIQAFLIHFRKEADYILFFPLMLLLLAGQISTLVWLIKSMLQIIQI